MSDLSIHRAGFLKSVFGPLATGYFCIAALPAGTRKLKERFFKWPNELQDAVDYISEVVEGHNVYFCPQLFRDPNFRITVGDKQKGPRVKENVKVCPNAWADLDECAPGHALIKPSLVLQSSPGRYQALWVFDQPVEPEVAEDISARIAYYHADQGADRSGWDLTQLLRVAYTYNYNHGSPTLVEPIGFSGRTRALYRPDDFKPYPAVTRRSAAAIPMPEPEDLPDIEDPVLFIQERRRYLNSDVFRLFGEKPDTHSWSEPLWKLMMYLFEGGLTREQVFVLAREAACNKYRRDNRPDAHLWNDVCRAYVKHMEAVKAVVVPELEEVELLTEEETERVKGRSTFVERYTEWAKGLGDAAPQYHQAGAFVILSSILSGRVSLPTSFGTVVPNLWFMLLADTTLTRKTTAMDLATELLVEVDPDVILATDGSIEGLLQGLSTRPGRPSIFLRDEFAGLLESMTKKDYMAGMAEMLTKLYDGKFQKRLLRKEPIEIRDPILILFTGGIRTRIQQLLTLDHVASGFMPRFIYLTAESDVSRVRPLGPPVVRDVRKREELLSYIRDLYQFYAQTVNVDVHGTGIHLAPPRKWHAELTPKAWERFNQFEAAMLKAGVDADRPELLTPVYARLTMSTLKAAVLLAASEMRDDNVIVEEADIVQAIYYAAQWRIYAIEVINGVGKSQSERDLERVYGAIRRSPGVSRSTLMQSFHLTARGADAIFQTLEQRGLITSVKYGRGTVYQPVGGGEESGK